MKKITIIVENTCLRHNLLASHWQAILIETEDKKILFDVWEIFVWLKYNLEQKKVNFSDIDAIVISHRHIDHIWALKDVIPFLTKNQPIYLPKQLWLEHIKKSSEKYSYLKKEDSGDYNLAISESEAHIVTQYKNSILSGTKGIEVAKNIFTTACIWDKILEQWLIIDEQELWITVLVWCSHPTVEKMVESAIETTGNKKVRWIIGGFHFTDMTEEEIRKKVDWLKTLHLEFIAPWHCTWLLWNEIMKAELWEIVHFSKSWTLGVWNSIELWEELKFNFV